MILLTVLVSIALVLVAATILIGAAILTRIKTSGSDDFERVMREELRIAREDASRQGRDLREEVAGVQSNTNVALVTTMNETAARDRELITKMNQASEAKLDAVRTTIDERLRLGIEDQRKHLSEVILALTELRTAHGKEQEKAREILDQKFLQILQSNEAKLEQIRKTVDEKLQETLEKRLGESFKLVSERLEAVHKGLGEMQTLANGVGDLKRVLTNVKERGTWGEYQLEAILDEILTPDQFDRNVAVTGGSERVEFAVKLPGRGVSEDTPVWLPIDSKFPKEDYERVVDSARNADTAGVEIATSALLTGLKKCAKDIRDKYIDPPLTTDFAILFLPTEGLYAEVLRQPGFHDELQRTFRVLVAGPTTLSALLNSLRMGFQTLAIEKRAHEVWSVLGAVKTEFGKFGEVLDKVKKQLETAGRTLDQTSVRSRAMEKKLRDVAKVPAGDSAKVLGIGDAATDVADEPTIADDVGSGSEDGE
jgi:DNA recombination protein RmuC